MKTLVILNIGLETAARNRVELHHALGAIAACGVSITSSAVVTGEWQGEPEPCLFIQGFVADPLGVAFRAQLYLASRLLSQHVLAIYFDGRGELIGENPKGWTFEKDKFHFHPSPVRKPELSECQALLDAIDGGGDEIPLSECQAIQKETAERILRTEYEASNSVQAGSSIERIAKGLGVSLDGGGDEIPLSECQAIQKETALAFIRA